MVQRDSYVNKIEKKAWNGRIKVVTGIRRCGKSTLVFSLYKQHLLESGTSENSIIEIILDQNRFAELRNPDKLAIYLRERITDSSNKYYVLIDEIQYAISSEELKNPDQPVRIYSVLNELLSASNVDVVVTGSNSKLLSKDISTEFRGRGDIIHAFPLSFREFCTAKNMEVRDAYDEYLMYGGMPYLLQLDSDEEKAEYLSNLFEEIYFKDIEERYSISLPGVLRDLTNALCSSVGSLTNASKLSRTLHSVRQVSVNPETVSTYLSYLTDAFLFSEALRFDVRGKKYFEYPSKYYCTDLGLRNARLGFRQYEETHLLENVIYNELLIRGYSVDVGVIPLLEKGEDRKYHQRNCEIDFVARKGSAVYYIQSALNMDNVEKQETELRPLLAIKDSFRKIVVSKSYGKRWIDEKGVLHISALDFLWDADSLND